jgi:hypothetical protein
MKHLFVLAQVRSDEINIPRVDFTAVNIAKALQIVLGFAGAIAVLIITIAGIQYIISQGNPQSTQKARNAIIDALIGLAICITAFSIVGFVISHLQ